MKHLLLTSLLFVNFVFANFKVGDTLPAIILEDQFGQVQKVTSKDTIIIMTFEKDVSIAIADYLKVKPNKFLINQNTKYISDVSSMPSLMMSIFAIPKMKKYKFSIMLIKDELGEKFNREDGKITVLYIKARKIKNISFIAPKEISKIFIK